MGAPAASASADGGGGGSYTPQVDPSGLINPALFPTIDASKVTTAATDIRSIGSNVKTDVTDLNTEWKKLKTCYHSPEEDQVYALQDPSQKAAEEIDDKLGKCAKALDQFATDLGGIKPDLEQITKDATAFRAEALAGYDEEEVNTDNITTGYNHVRWQEHKEAVDRNNELLRKFNLIMERVSTAETTCAKTINDLIGNQVYKIDVKPAITHEQLDHAPNLPWGFQSKEQASNCFESIGMAGTDTIGSGINLIRGLATGYDPATDESTSATRDAYWGSLGNFALSAVIVGTGADRIGWGAEFFGVHNPVTDYLANSDMVVGNAVLGIINIDPTSDHPFKAYEDDPLRATVGSGLNILTFFIPGADVADILKVGGFAGKVAKVGGVAADTVLPGTTALAKLIVDTVKVGGKGSEVAGDVGKVAEGAADAAKGVKVPLGGLTSTEHGVDTGGAASRSSEAAHDASRLGDVASGSTRPTTDVAGGTHPGAAQTARDAATAASHADRLPGATSADRSATTGSHPGAAHPATTTPHTAEHPAADPSHPGTGVPHPAEHPGTSTGTGTHPGSGPGTPAHSVTHPSETVELTTKKADPNRYVDVSVTTHPVSTAPHDLHAPVSDVHFDGTNPHIWDEKVRGVDGRGIHAEDLSQAALDKGHPDLERLVQNHKDFDFVSDPDGTPKLISTKSIDPDLKSYAGKPSAVASQISKWAEGVETAGGGAKAPITVTTESGASLPLRRGAQRELNIVIPESSLTPATIDAINQVIKDYKDIDFSFTRVER